MMETVAAAFAMDVPSIALLVLPSSAPVKRAVWELRELGVNAHGLDLQDTNKGRSYLASGGGTSANPTLLVSTLATTRGLDLPALSHVFLYGLPDGARVNSRTVDAYLHIAGRVGRFGRSGKVVTLVEDSSSEVEAEEGSYEGSEEAQLDEHAGAGKKMARILQTIGVEPVQFAAFQ
jgi:superfamily II DNA/RNA helicase